ncbi:DNA-binding transcriptional regulator, AcrR family [Actinokineospora alba]|uniref:DNA-binding transcriptional regulator, AcrR family n=1 Tax=Actinokineospora alba TaxID=504798 RepID=A0A1H0WH22_9PSEU|nr:TetR/AcrR family transcriptional regulator [Actinokineospora alba]TDP65318.1 TetR family transcriptional regulator [Actinokineospora alba]SDH59626.1 DNA-binding transcriptional regulator, AcrR family [Actinokineospora alba]SDP89775.1 DNA-binding transcriptional regulator, AcrR family [Actinokineospora alba]
MPRPKTHDDALRVRLLDRAGELVSAQGASALSLRKLASDVDTSTTAVYSLFGGKPALVRELYVEAFDRLGRRLRTVTPSDDPKEDLVRLGLAYREAALADPHLYGVMFGDVIPGFEPDEDAHAEALAALAPLRDLIHAGVDAGVFAGPTQDLAVACWGIVHGLVSLELSGNLPPDLDVERTYERALRNQLVGWLL